MKNMDHIVGTFHERLDKLEPIIRGTGHHFITDGQYGSTGKGVWASFVAMILHKTRHVSVCNAGPNSGHTSYDNNNNKVVLKQLPTVGVLAALNYPTTSSNVYLTAGSIISPEILYKEARLIPNSLIVVHPNAACISPKDVETENTGTVAEVAGTRQGVGAALARKILRDPYAIFRHQYNIDKVAGTIPNNIVLGQMDYTHDDMVFIHEVSQGFSLGINSSFYPKTTSRECTAMQAMADARVHPDHYRSTTMVLRTFPIRVGNFEGHSSGDCYMDQQETSWEDLNLEAEMTTVTGRVRRVFSFSTMQLEDALVASRPKVLFLNFMNYLTHEQGEELVKNVLRAANNVLGYEPLMFFGYGPTWLDVK